MVNRVTLAPEAQLVYKVSRDKLDIQANRD